MEYTINSKGDGVSVSTSQQHGFSSQIDTRKGRLSGKSRVIVVVGLTAVSIFQLAGCYLGPRRVTYPSPKPLSGERVVYPGEFATVDAQIAAGVIGFASLCGPHERGSTRSAVAFMSRGVQLCFYTPNAGDRLTCMSVYGIGRHGPLNFEMYVSGAGVELNDPRATLNSSGQSLVSTAEIRDATYAGGLEEAPPGAKPIIPGAPHLIYSIARKELVFRFDLPCDPNTHYQLSVAGIMVKGREIQVPPIDFDPHSEWRQTGLD